MKEFSDTELTRRIIKAEASLKENVSDAELLRRQTVLVGLRQEAKSRLSYESPEGVVTWSEIAVKMVQFVVVIIVLLVVLTLLALVLR